MESLKEFTDMIGNMKHTIGFNEKNIKGTKYRKYKSYRNFFMGNEKSLDKAVELGLAEKKKSCELICGDFCYSITKKGFKFLSELTGVEITKGE